MALINCSECNKQISDKSDECIGCGAPSHVFLKSKENLITEPVAENLTPVEEIISIEELTTEIDSNEEISEEEVVEFDKKDPKYLAIKITNVVLFIILFIVEAGMASIDGGRPNPIAVYITFLISRWVVRYLYTKKSNFRNNKIYYKFGGTILIWVFVFLVKQMIGITILNLAL